MKAIIAAISMAWLQGCATMTLGTTQSINVELTNMKPAITSCRFVNEEDIKTIKLAGSGAVKIHRDGNVMQVNCETDTHRGYLTVEPDFVGAFLFLNLLTDLCIFSCIIDAGTNAWYNYPGQIHVIMMPMAIGGEKK